MPAVPGQTKVRAVLDPNSEMEVVKDSATSAMNDVFPIVGKTRELRLGNVRVDDTLSWDDLRGQLDAKLNEKTWGVPLNGTLSLIDKLSGKVLDKKDVRLAELPKLTPRLSYLVNGQEYQLDKQWRLKPGIYARVKDNGELESHINVAGGERYALNFDPTSRRFMFDHAGSSIPLFPMLRALGVDDSTLRLSWGKEIYDANATEKYEGAIRKFYRVSTGKEAPSLDVAVQHLRQTLPAKELSPDVTEHTLGVRVDRLNGQALALASKNLLSIARGTREPDDRDAILFKNLFSTEDYVGEKIRVMGSGLRRRLTNTIDRHNNLEHLVYPGMFDKAVASVFTESAVSRIPTQDNPVEMLEGFSRTTIIGPGAIGDTRMVTDEAKAVDKSHLGFLDPIDTPEGEKVGIASHLALGVSKKGNELFTPVYDVRQKRMVPINTATFYRSNVALPDSVRWVERNGTKVPEAVDKQVRIAGPGNDMADVPWDKVDYVIPNAAMLMGTGTNLVPFAQNNSGNRLSMSARHLGQTVPLVHREAALVQSAGPEGKSMDRLPGALTAASSRVAGVVTKVERGAIHIRDAAGKSHTHQIYDYFPLNDKRTGIHAEPVVKVGDHVKDGQLIADSWFTKDGRLAIGANMRTAFLALPVMTHEDSVVISESAAKNLASLHLHRHQFVPDENTKVGKAPFAAYYPARYGSTQLDKLDSDGIVREGQKVVPGDPLTLALRPQQYTTETQAIARLSKSLVKPYADTSTTWEQDVPGTVVRVHKLPDGRAHVVIATEEPMQVADKLSNRHAGKGTVGAVYRDDQMPKDKNGKPVDIVMNPYAIPGRQNIGQVYEMAAGKIAIKTGKPYMTRNYQPGVDYGELLRKEMKEHGLDEQEELFDAQTGASLGKALVGPMYILKQRHQVDRKIHARAGGPGYPYDIDRQPRRGGEGGAQSLGGLGELALLAHGARSILREAHSSKSDMASQDEMWRAIQLGQPLPPPRPTFAQKKFEGYLNTLGVRLKKDGTRVQMVPLTDHDTLRMSSGALSKPNLTLKGHELIPETGGLFDPHVTGGLDGDRMSHIQLPESIPNPFFERGVLALTGMTQDQLLDVLGGRLAVDKERKLVAAKTPGSRTGSDAVGWMLDQVDVKKDAITVRAQLPKLTGTQLDRSNRKLRYLEALDEVGLRPRTAYMTSVIPVLPPTMRPLTVLPTGDLASDPLNETYKALGTVVSKYEDMDPSLPDRSRGRLRKELYTSLSALQGVGAGYKRIQGGETQGIMDVFTQPTAKHAWIFQHLFKPRQDLSARSVITPDPDITIDEVGVPHRIATEIFKPFTVRELSRVGYSPLQAEQMIKANDPMAEASLRKVMSEKLVLMKRDPVLHQQGIQALKPIMRKGLSITINPMIAAGYGADFDGDQTALFVPQSPAAQQEARGMLPSVNLLHKASGRPVYAPTNEMQLGLFRATTIKPDPHAPNYKTVEEALAAAVAGKQKWGTINVGGRATTMGRVRLWATLPMDMRKDAILYDPNVVWNSKVTGGFLKQLAETHAPEYAGVAQKVMNLGASNVYEQAFSLSLNDFRTDTQSRDAAFRTANSDIRKLPATLSKIDRDSKTVGIWVNAGEAMEKAHWDKVTANPPQLAMMALAGIKPSRDQYKQLVMAPMIVAGIKGKPIPVPVGHSFSEGLTTSDFWTQAQAARVASMRKTQEVREPGYLSKQIINTVADTVVASRDCGTTEGIAMAVDHPDVTDRYLAKAAPGAAAGGLVTQSLVDHWRKEGTQSVVVRSPLKCKLPQGICQRCSGLMGDGHLPGIGTNIGVIAGQALGERSTQLMLKSVHCLHEHTVVTVRCRKRVWSTTLGRLYERYAPTTRVGSAPVDDLSVWSNGKWNKIRSVVCHEQTPGTTMVMLKTRAGGFIISQDNHPHMLAEAPTICACGTIPKPENAKRRISGWWCRKCGVRVKVLAPSSPVLAVEPRSIGRRTHNAVLVPPPPADWVGVPLQDGWLAGMYAAEGCVQVMSYDYMWKDGVTKSRYSYRVGVDIAEPKGFLQKRVLQSAKQEHPRLRVTHDSRKVHFYDVSTAAYYERCFGRYAWNKGLPDGWTGFNRKWLGDFLAGMIDGDGTVSRNQESCWYNVGISTTSALLAEQLRWIVERLGGCAHVNTTPWRKSKIRRKDGSIRPVVSKHQGYIVGFSYTAPLVGWLGECTKLGGIPAREKNIEQAQPELVEFIQPIRFLETPLVYDLETEDGTLAANGIWTHNSGGVVGKGSGSSAINQFDRIEHLLRMPKVIPNAAVLAENEGVVKSVRADPAGGFRVGIEAHGKLVDHHVPGTTKLAPDVRAGYRVSAGTPLSTGYINMHDLLRTAGLPAVQNQITNELDDIYRPQGIRRRNVEVVVRGITNLGQVEDAGGHEHMRRGDMVPLSVVHGWNESHKDHIKVSPMLKGIAFAPLDLTEDWMSKLHHERLKDTLVDAALEGHQADVAGLNPFSAIAFSPGFGTGLSGKPGAY
jgi:DNA-directed RNA polymerase beta subunit/DNA-directed RNA polymerase beta' subunit